MGREKESRNASHRQRGEKQSEKLIEKRKVKIGRRRRKISQNGEKLPLLGNLREEEENKRKCTFTLQLHYGVGT